MASVTIVIASRDRPGFLRRSTAAVLAQRDVEVEVVLVDDGSVVPVAEALDDVVAEADGRVRVLRCEESEGVSAARNRGLATADGEWVGFCDDDDIWAPDKVSSQLAAAHQHGSTWTCSGAVAVDLNLEPLFVMRAPADQVDTGPVLLEANIIPGGGSAVVARTEAVRDLGGFDTEMSALADWEMWIRLGAAEPLASVDRPLVAYVVQPVSMSSDTAGLRNEVARLRRKHAAAYERAGTEVDQRRWMHFIGIQEVRCGHQLAAARAFARSGWAGPSLTPLGAAVLALAWPTGLQRHHDRRRRADMPPGWEAELRGWLANIAHPRAEIPSPQHRSDPQVPT